MKTLLQLLLSCLLPAISHAQSYAPVEDRPPALAREFRGAWIACIYNLDWPSSSGLGAGTQQAELRDILDKIAALKMNAVIFQVRPQGDAVYSSSMEPWSASLTGTMGRSPGYDPLAYCIKRSPRPRHRGPCLVQSLPRAFQQFPASRRQPRHPHRT